MLPVCPIDSPSVLLQLTIQHKFITIVVLPNNKINNSGCHMQNQVRPLDSNAHIFKTDGH